MISSLRRVFRVVGIFASTAVAQQSAPLDSSGMSSNMIPTQEAS